MSGTGSEQRSAFSAKAAAGLVVVVAAVAAVLIWWPRDQGSEAGDPSKPPQPPPPRHADSDQPKTEDFVGSEVCAECHQHEYDVWKRSTHGQAGGPPQDVKVIARFDGEPLRFADAVVTPFVNAGGNYAFRVEIPGEQPWEAEVDLVVGGGHMHGGGTQTFFKRFPDGTVRFLPFDYIRDEDVWFVQHHNGKWLPITAKISLLRDVANWPPRRVLGGHAGLDTCQNCHGSQVHILHDQTTGAFRTTFTSLRINCESCHGAGRRHVELARQPGFAEREDIGMQPLATLTKDQSLDVCFQCHATKKILRSGHFPNPGTRMDHHISLKMANLDGDGFLVDGRVARFGYQGNHLYSDCYLNGSMTCVDCHDPHSQDYRDVFFEPLQGKFDDGQCTSCHASKAEDITRHTHHAPDSAGSRCTSCHMPFLQHQGLGDKLRFARSDHVIPIPRPAFDEQLGIENACAKCHKDKDTAALQTQVDAWYGAIKPHAAAVANLIAARDVKDPKTAKELLVQPELQHAFAQMEGLFTYLQRFAPPVDQPVDRDLVARLSKFAQRDDLDLKAVALLALDALYGEDAEVRAFLARELADLGANEATVKTRWASVADELGGIYANAKDARNAVRFTASAVRATPDDPLMRSHLALTYMMTGDAQRAVPQWQAAILLVPEEADFHVKLGMCLLNLRKLDDAQRALEAAQRLSPQDPQIRSMLDQIRATRK